MCLLEEFRILCKNNGDIKKIIELLQKIDVCINKNSPIQIASDTGHIEAVKYLLKDPRVDPSDMDCYALILASANGYSEIVKLLLEDERVDPSIHDNEALRRTIICGHTETLKVLMEHYKVNCAVNDNFPLYFAAKSGSINLVEVLLENHNVRNDKESIKKILYELESDSSKYRKIFKMLQNVFEEKPTKKLRRY